MTPFAINLCKKKRRRKKKGIENIIMMCAMTIVNPKNIENNNSRDLSKIHKSRTTPMKTNLNIIIL